jgi:predicted DNA-binding WGR domain protein
MPTVTKRCFEFRDPPRHSKFWTIEVAGSTAFVTYGRIGTAGAVQVKPFPSRIQVEDFANKMIREKIKKGYHEVANDRHAGAPAQQLAAATGSTSEVVVSGRRRSPPVPSEGPTEGERSIDI